MKIVEQPEDPELLHDYFDMIDVENKGEITFRDFLSLFLQDLQYHDLSSLLNVKTT